MGLFGNNEEKQAQKVQAILAKYDMEGLSDPRDQQAIVNIAQNMAGMGLMQAGVDIGLGTNEKAMQQVQMHLQRTIMEQNFIMIRQLDRIAKALEK